MELFDKTDKILLDLWKSVTRADFRPFGLFIADPYISLCRGENQSIKFMHVY